MPVPGAVRDSVLSERSVRFTKEQIGRVWHRRPGTTIPSTSMTIFARSVGLPGLIAHGMLQMGLMGVVAAEAAGGPDKLTRLYCRFAGMVLPGDTSPSPRSRPVRASSSCGRSTRRASGAHEVQRRLQSVTLDFSLTPEQKAIRQLAHEFAERDPPGRGAPRRDRGISLRGRQEGAQARPDARRFPARGVRRPGAGLPDRA